MIVRVESSFALPLVSVAIAFRAGAAHDPLGKEGLARMAARMIRRGTLGPNGPMTAVQVEEAIDALGGELGAEVGYGWLSIGMEVIERNLDPFADLVASILGGPAFDDTELGKLRREIEGELVEARDNDRGLAGRALRRTLFEGHAYGRRTMGTIASVKAVGRDDIAAFYQRHVCQENAVVAVSGHITEDRGQELARRLLAKLPEGVPSPDPVTEPTRRPGRTLVFVDKPERTQTQMYIGTLGTHPRDPDQMALHVANNVFGGTFTARLMNEVRSKRGWSYGASSRLGMERHRESFSIWTAPAETDAAACLSLELGLLETWIDGGVTDDELAFTQSYLARSHVFDIDTAGKRAHQTIDAEVFGLPEGYHARYVENVKRVTKADADAAVRARISANDLVVAVVGTHATLGKAIEQAIPGLSSTIVVPYDAE